MRVIFWLHTLAVFTSILLFVGPGLSRVESSDDHQVFYALESRLVKQGFDRVFVESLYRSPEVSFDKDVVSVYFLHREGKLNYDQFLTEKSIDKTVQYYRRHEKTLKRVEEAYGVEGEVICAIILVETRLGRVTGRRLVINTLSTLADLNEKSTRDRLWRAHLRGKAKESKKQFEAWAARKSAWAFSELKAYLEYVQGQDMDPLSIRGSFAGAMGIAQFIPSSVQAYARDGNADGRVDLLHHEDAIESVGNYLKQHGWRPALSRDEAFTIILKYNNSKYYAETILSVAERVEEERRKLRAGR